MGNCIIKRHLYIKETFGTIAPTRLAASGAVQSFSFTGTTSNSLYVFCCGIDTASATPPTLSSVTVSTGSGNKVLYSSPSGYAACGVVRLNSGSTCSVTLSRTSYYLVVKIPVENADIEVIDKKIATGASSGTAAPSVTNCKLGSLYIGAGSGGKHNGSVSAVYSKTGGDGSNITYNGGWDIHNIGTFIPTSSTNTFQCGASFYDAQSSHNKYVCGYMFRVYKKIWLGGHIVN